MDAARRTKGLRDSAEALALYVARVFGYGCRVIKPLVVACLFSLALSATFVGLGGPTLTSIPTGDTAVTMVHPLKVVFALWFDLLALPLSSLRTSITDVAWTTQAMRSLGVQARVGVVAALLVNGGAYLAALAAAARYVRRRSGEFIIE